MTHPNQFFATNKIVSATSTHNEQQIATPYSKLLEPYESIRINFSIT